MGLIKILGLAALAALAAMAFVGPSSASAILNTCLTTTDPQPLESCSDQPSLVHFHDPAATILTSTPKLTIKCEALFEGHNLGLATAPNQLALHVLPIVLSNCNNQCHVLSITPGLLLLLKTAIELGVLTGHGTELHVECGEAIDCEYNWEGLEGHFLGGLLALPGGGETAHIAFTEAALNTSGSGFCPAAAKLTTLLLSLTKMYLRG